MAENAHENADTERKNAALRRAAALLVVASALRANRNPNGQDWHCPPDWTGFGFDYPARIAVDALIESGLLDAEQYDGEVTP